MRRTGVLLVLPAALLGLALAAVLPAAGQESGPQSGTYTVPVDRLVIFKKPAPYFGSAGEAAQGEVLAVTGSRGPWLAVLSEAGVEGWILPPQEETTALRAASGTGVGLVTRGFAPGYAKRHGAGPADLEFLEAPRFEVQDLEGFADEGGLNRVR